MSSRVTTTRVLAEAIAASDDRSRRSWPATAIGDLRRPRRRARVDRGDADSRSDALLARVTRAWQAATEPAARRRGTGLRPAHLAPSTTGAASRWARCGCSSRRDSAARWATATQYVPIISTRDWVDAVVHLAETRRCPGPFNLCCERVPTNAELTRSWPTRCTARPFFRVPAFVLRRAAGRDGPRAAQLGATPTRPPCSTAASASATPTSARCCARVSHPSR